METEVPKWRCPVCGGIVKGPYVVKPSLKKCSTTGEIESHKAEGVREPT